MFGRLRSTDGTSSAAQNGGIGAVPNSIVGALAQLSATELRALTAATYGVLQHNGSASVDLWRSRTTASERRTHRPKVAAGGRVKSMNTQRGDVPVADGQVFSVEPFPLNDANHTRYVSSDSSGFIGVGRRIGRLTALNSIHGIAAHRL